MQEPQKRLSYRPLGSICFSSHHMRASLFYAVTPHGYLIKLPEFYIHLSSNTYYANFWEAYAEAQRIKQRSK